MTELVLKNKKICSGSTPLICVSLMGESLEELTCNLNNIINESKESRIDIVEFRGDFYRDLEDESKLTQTLKYISDTVNDKILLFTIRSPKEGGQSRGYDKKSIEEINRFVIDNKLADMVDIELMSAENALIQLAKERGVKIIMSNHDFQKTPSREIILERLTKMQAMGADIAKIAVMPIDEGDLLTLLQATYEMKTKHNDTPIVTMSMGSKGALSRTAGEVFGSAITFGAVGEASAPGQIPVKVLNDMLENIHNYCVE